MSSKEVSLEFMLSGEKWLNFTAAGFYGAIEVLHLGMSFLVAVLLPLLLLTAVCSRIIKRQQISPMQFARNFVKKKRFTSSRKHIEIDDANCRFYEQHERALIPISFTLQIRCSSDASKKTAFCTCSDKTKETHKNKSSNDEESGELKELTERIWFTREIKQNAKRQRDREYQQVSWLPRAYLHTRNYWFSREQVLSPSSRLVSRAFNEAKWTLQKMEFTSSEQKY